MFYSGPLDFSGPIVSGPASTSFRSAGGPAGTSYGALPQLDGTGDQADGAELEQNQGDAGAAVADVEQADLSSLGAYGNTSTVEYYAQSAQDMISVSASASGAQHRQQQQFDPLIGAVELAGIDGSESASVSHYQPIKPKAIGQPAQIQYARRPPAPPRIAPRMPLQTTRLILQPRAAPAVIQQPVPVISSLYTLPTRTGVGVTRVNAPPPPPPPPVSFAAPAAEPELSNVLFTGGYSAEPPVPNNTSDRPFIKVARKSRVDVSTDSFSSQQQQYVRPPLRLSDQYFDSFGQHRGAQQPAAAATIVQTPAMGRGSYIAQQQPIGSQHLHSASSTSRAATGGSNLEAAAMPAAGGMQLQQPDAGFIIMDEDSYFGAKPRDFYQVRQKIESGGYAMPSQDSRAGQHSGASPIEDFADDVIRIIVRKLAISMNTMTDNEQLNNYSQWLKITFLKRMKSSFPWLSIQSRNGWSANLRVPIDLLPNASLPPSSDHEYHQFRQLHADNARKELERDASASSQQQRRSRAYVAAEERAHALLEEVEHEHEAAEEERLRREAEEELTRELDLEAKRALQQVVAPAAVATSNGNGVHSAQLQVGGSECVSAASTTTNGAECLGAAGVAEHSSLVAVGALDWEQIRQDEIVNSLNDAPDPSDPRVCVLCGRRGDDKPQLGGRLLYCVQDRWIHVNCAIWTPEIYEDNHGMLQNVLQAICRGRQTVRPHVQHNTSNLQSFESSFEIAF